MYLNPFNVETFSYWRIWHFMAIHYLIAFEVGKKIHEMRLSWWSRPILRSGFFSWLDYSIIKGCEARFFLYLTQKMHIEIQFIRVIDTRSWHVPKIDEETIALGDFETSTSCTRICPEIEKKQSLHCKKEKPFVFTLRNAKCAMTMTVSRTGNVLRFVIGVGLQTHEKHSISTIIKHSIDSIFRQLFHNSFSTFHRFRIVAGRHYAHYAMSGYDSD